MTLHTFMFPRIYLNRKCAKPLFTYPSWSDILHLNPLCGLLKQRDRATASYIIFYCTEEKDPTLITRKIHCNTRKLCLCLYARICTSTNHPTLAAALLKEGLVQQVRAGWHCKSILIVELNFFIKHIIYMTLHREAKARVVLGGFFWRKT